MFQSQRFKSLIEGKPVILVNNGMLDIDHLHRESITIEELEESFREHGVDSYKKVKVAILEVDGNISVISEQGKELKQTLHKRKKIRNLTRMT